MKKEIIAIWMCAILLVVFSSGCIDWGESKEENKKPVADAGIDQNISIDVIVYFNGSASYDLDGSITNYTWSFGDGNFGYGVAPTHLYTEIGNYTVILTVTDNDGAISTDFCIIRVNNFTFVLEMIENIAWKPDGGYALMVGGEDLFKPDYHYQVVVKYDGSNIEILLNKSYNESSYFTLTDAAWKPDGSYALITGTNGTVWKYDGENFFVLDSGVSEPLWSIEWKPNGEYALIVGYGTILKYDGNDFITFENVPQAQLWEIAWRPDGSYALITSTFNRIVKFNGDDFEILTTDYNNYSWQHLTWDSDGNCAFVTGQHNYINGAHQIIIKYDGENFTLVEGPISNFISGILWNPHWNNYSYYFEGTRSWKPDGEYLLIVENGKIIKEYVQPISWMP
ncbi:MAG: PKD domain-containing protein [Thermoplasmatales archaeon]|nr:PKD domain-containing protein [Thermoplasmatales archaeon]